MKQTQYQNQNQAQGQSPSEEGGNKEVAEPEKELAKTGVEGEISNNFFIRLLNKLF